MLFQRLALLAVAVFLANGCQNTTRLTNIDYPPKAAHAPIEVIASATAPAKPYLEIAMVSESSEFGSREAMFESLRIQARKVGADAVLVQPGFQDSYSSSSFFGSKTNLEGVAIKWK